MMLRALSFSARRSVHSVRASDIITRRGITATTTQAAKAMPPRPPLVSEDEFTEAFLKGSGPGGQKINKTSSAVQLRHLPTGIVLKVQATRSRDQNRRIARRMLAERVEVLEKGPESRVMIVGQVKKRKKNSAVKKSRRKYKALAEAQDQTGVDESLDVRDDAAINEFEDNETGASRRPTTGGIR